MNATALEPEHVIYGAVHDPRHQWWKIPCRCGRCGKLVTLTVDDEDLAAGGVPTRCDVQRLLDRHCGYWAAKHRDDRVERGVSVMQQVWETVRLHEQYQELAIFRQFIDSALFGMVRMMGIPRELLEDCRRSGKTNCAKA